MSEHSLLLSLYFDEDVSIRIVRSLRNRGFDAQHAMEVGMKGKSADEQLRFASARGRTLVPHDRVDFERLYAKYMAQGREHHGIIVAKRRRDNEEIVRRLLQVLDTVTPEEMMQQLRYI